MLVPISGVLFLQPSAVGKADPGQGDRRPGGIDRTPKAVPNEPGEVADVVEVGMGENDRIDFGWRYRKGLPVPFPQLA
jgi:hypothetical protein